MEGHRHTGDRNQTETQRHVKTTAEIGATHPQPRGPQGFSLPASRTVRQEICIVLSLSLWHFVMATLPSRLMLLLIYLPLPITFIVSCRSVFQLSIIFLVPDGFLLTFPVVWFCSWWLTLAFVFLRNLRKYTFIFERHFARDGILWWQTYFHHSKILLNSLLTCIVSDKKFRYILNFAPLHIMHHSPLFFSVCF